MGETNPDGSTRVASTRAAGSTLAMLAGWGGLASPAPRTSVPAQTSGAAGLAPQYNYYGPPVTMQGPVSPSGGWGYPSLQYNYYGPPVTMTGPASPVGGGGWGGPRLDYRPNATPLGGTRLNSPRDVQAHLGGAPGAYRPPYEPAPELILDGGLGGPGITFGFGGGRGGSRRDPYMLGLVNWRI